LRAGGGVDGVWGSEAFEGAELGELGDDVFWFGQNRDRPRRRPALLRSCVLMGGRVGAEDGPGCRERRRPRHTETLYESVDVAGGGGQ
jgi:hypothetical protein